MSNVSTSPHLSTSSVAAKLDPQRAARHPHSAWLWIMLLGAGMLLGAVLVGLIAFTSVTPPYDQAFVRLTSLQLAAVNPHLLPFMAHDRVTLAGTMLSLGVIYGQLALHAMSKGEHWAMWVVLVSGGVGFASFFLFLGFGYFDPLHAIVTSVLFLYFLLGLRAWFKENRVQAVSCLWERPDRPGPLWGQVLLLLAGLGMSAAGMVIAVLGATTVFVPEDFVFLQTTSTGLHAVNSHLIPLIAHDRAGFAGALLADGLGILLMVLWGFRPEARWLWWTLLGAGLCVCVPAVGIHLLVGYTSFSHLAPVLSGAFLYSLGLIFSYSFLHRNSEAFQESRK